MSTLASLRILLGLDSTDVSRGASKVRGELGGVQREANKTRDAFAGIKSGLVGGLGLGAGIGAFNVASRAVSEFTDFIGGSITKASALQETMSKSAVVFGQDAAAVERWGKTAATAFGQSTQQAIEARATLGNLFKTMGLGQSEVLGMSENVVELASDLASFNNIGTDDALTKLRAGLVGEAEPLRALGVQLTEVSVKAKAVELGLVGANGQLSESAKVQARYAIILEQTATAQGDFSRTSDGLANQQKILAAQIENAAAKMGTLLLPVLADGAKLINNTVLPTFDLAAEGIQNLADEALHAVPGIGAFFDSLEGGSKTAGASLLDFLPIGGLLRQAYADIDAATIAAAEAQAQQTSEIDRARQAWIGHLIVTRDLDKAVKELGVDILLAGNAADDAGANLRHFAGDVRGLTQDIGDAARALGHFKDDAGGVPSQLNVTQDFDPTHPGGAPAGLHPAANKAALDKIAADEKAARDAETAANKAARDAETAANKAAAERARRDAEQIRWQLDDAFSAAQDSARDFYDEMHTGNLKAIDDIRDRRNAELDAQRDVIRGVVSAERSRIDAVRAREQENELRADVAAAEPEDRADAQRALNRFLEDQRLGRMSVAADLAVAQIDAEKAKNDAIAAEATNAENTRAADQRKAFDTEIAALQKNLSRHPELWAETSSAVLKLLEDSIPLYGALGQKSVDAFIGPLKKLGVGVPSVSATSPNASAGAGLTSAGGHEHVIHNHLYLNGQEVMDWIERGLANNNAVYNPAPPSASGRV